MPVWDVYGKIKSLSYCTKRIKLRLFKMLGGVVGRINPVCSRDTAAPTPVIPMRPDVWIRRLRYLFRYQIDSGETSQVWNGNRLPSNSKNSITVKLWGCIYFPPLSPGLNQLFIDLSATLGLCCLCITIRLNSRLT